MRYDQVQAPASRENVNAARGAAIASDSQSVAAVTTVINSATGTKRLQITLTNTTADDKLNVVLFPGVQSDAAGAALPEGVNFAAKDFASREAFLSYFAHVSTTFQGARVKTTNTENILSQFITISEKDPSGDERKITRDLYDYAHDIGGGSYSRDAEIPAQDFTITLWAALRMTLGILKASSSLTISFNTVGWNKAQGMTSLSTSSL